LSQQNRAQALRDEENIIGSFRQHIDFKAIQEGIDSDGGAVSDEEKVEE
jgi:hypothetical protein